MSTSTTFEALLKRLDPDKAERLRALFAGRKINPTDPLWEVMVSLDMAVVLLETGPQSLEALLQHHQSQLQSWSTQHLNILHALSAEADALQQLSQLAPELHSTGQRLVEESPQVLTRLQDAAEALASVPDRYQQQLDRQELLLKHHHQLGKQLQRTVMRLEQNQRPSFLYRAPSSLVLLSVLFSGVSGAVSLVLLLQIL